MLGRDGMIPLPTVAMRSIEMRSFVYGVECGVDLSMVCTGLHQCAFIMPDR